uniref:Uncharacterized protein n=1 Tax=Glossina palpalis gambiensis TaxID=67801 RepID=A0A1B0AQ74_9MUSC
MDGRKKRKSWADERIIVQANGQIKCRQALYRIIVSRRSNYKSTGVYLYNRFDLTILLVKTIVMVVGFRDQLHDARDGLKNEERYWKPFSSAIAAYETYKNNSKARQQN